MRTKEFINKVVKLGFTISRYINPHPDATKTACGFHALIISDNEDNLVTIWTENQYAISTIEDGFWAYKINRPLNELYKLCFEYAATPIKDRGDTSKHIYKHNFIKTKGNSFTYLAIRQRPSISYPVLQGSNQDIFEYKVDFTDEEIEEVKKEYGIFLDDFKKVEVER